MSCHIVLVTQKPPPNQPTNTTNTTIHSFGSMDPNPQSQPAIHAYIYDRALFCFCLFSAFLFLPFFLAAFFFCLFFLPHSAFSLVFEYPIQRLTSYCTEYVLHTVLDVVSKVRQGKKERMVVVRRLCALLCALVCAFLHTYYV